jgi:WD40 repeat protein
VKKSLEGKWLPMKAFFCLALRFCAAITIVVAQTVYPPTSPFLRIETGMHTKGITSMDMDAAERFLVTASEDKTARIWNLVDGQLLRVLRPPIGSGLDGRLYAIAISLDGSTIAAGGETGPEGGPFSVYIFDRVSGALTHAIPGFSGWIGHLSFSADGQYLAVALGNGNNALQVYRLSDYGEAAHDRDYGGNCVWADFDRTGRLVTASFDGFVRLYDQNFRLIAKKTAPGGKQPTSVRFSPDGGKVRCRFSRHGVTEYPFRT